MDIAALMRPAKEVGGDFYDFFLVDETHVGIVIADVSGKGVPAALFMVIAKTLIKNHLQSGLEPGKAIEAANCQLCENNKADMFVTVWAAIVDLSTGLVTYVNAGHNPPICLRSTGDAFWVRSKADMALGVFDVAAYHIHTIELETGDRLVLYTDGITEATDLREELYGNERLMKVMEKPFLKGSGLIEGVFADVDAFAGEAPQFDDMTMLVFQRL